jgi:hypothetical protein
MSTFVVEVKQQLQVNRQLQMQQLMVKTSSSYIIMPHVSAIVAIIKHNL